MEVFRFALLGLGIGALYALCAQGLVLIHRASGVVNFAQGGFLVVGGYVYFELRQVHHFPTAISVLGATLAGAALGAATHFLVIRPMRHSSPIAPVVATLGVLIRLQALAILPY